MTGPADGGRASGGAGGHTTGYDAGAYDAGTYGPGAYGSGDGAGGAGGPGGSGAGGHGGGHGGGGFGGPGDGPHGAGGHGDGGHRGGGHGSGGAEGAEGAEATDGPEDGERRGAKKQRSFWKELPLLIGIALVLALLIKTFLVQAFSIPSDSMMNTLQRGDRVLVDKLTPWFGSEPQRGEVVVFNDPGHWLENEPTPDPNPLQRFLGWIGLMPSSDEKDLIKRVIAVGGDTVSCKKGGKVVVNGKPLEESSYIYPGSTPCDDQPFGPIKVPEGRIWVMGDNRQNSLDSRYHQDLEGNGTVPNGNVVGRAIVVAWPATRWATLPEPDTFAQQGLSAAAAAAAGPGALGLAGALPLVLWRRKRLAERD
ncbi:signal peptidase I [Streptomyces sp. LP05-1]|uniref:Signal peptidase I n=1 Tax=Streptomyces pyxinae TaxID=2970734 RepID=A0ABT2CHI6_9ACTN|nr:signal peptidase I [Streptomyces sp. LP05-1]MCS0636572.1 signal peptidase I [Streptomyces sp. LP05-1]